MTDPEPCPEEMRDPIADSLALVRAAMADDHEAMLAVVLNLPSPGLTCIVLSQWMGQLMAQSGLGEETLRDLARVGGIPQG